LGFSEPRREIFEFLREPEAYRTGYEPRILAELVKRANAARASKDFVQAAAAFNRALAFRPDDTDLLRQVAQIARGERLRLALTRLAAGAVVTLLLAGIVFGVLAWLRSRPARPVAISLPSALPTGVTGSVAAPSAEAAEPLPADSGNARRQSADAARRNARTRPLASVPAAAVAETAIVRVLVDGPKNATVKVDGQEIVWFGPPHQLSVGPHTFEFVPPNEECCVAPQTMVVNVVRPNDPNEVQTVRGTIEFKPALLDFQGLPGTTASCGELGSFSVPSQQKIRMSTASVHAHCTLLAPPTSGQPPKEFDVTLSPGRLFSIPGS
jgi:hypothetical protein